VIARHATLAVTLLVACRREPSVLPRWLADWEIARRCMIASPEYGPDGATAAAVTSLVKNTDCFGERLALERVSEPEQAQFPDWDGLLTEIRQLRGQPEDGRVIDRIDARVNGLRERAGLSSIRRVRERTPALLPVGQRIMIAGNELATPAIITIQSGRILVHMARGPRFHAEITALDDVRTTIVPMDAELAYPSRAWAAEVTDDELTITETTEPERSRSFKLPGNFVALKAMDTATSRAVVLKSRHSSGLAIALSNARGSRWEVHRSPDSRSDSWVVDVSQDIETGTVDIITQTNESATMHRFAQLDPWQFPQPVEIPRWDDRLGCSEVKYTCRDSGALWAVDDRDDIVYRVSLPSSRTFQLKDANPRRVEDCRGDTALMLGGRFNGLTVCRNDRCKEVRLQAWLTFRGIAALLDDGTWIYAATTHGIVGVWREKSITAPEFYRLPGPDEPSAIAVLRGIPHLVIVDSGGVYRFVALPR
jgi:hypothetical protein